MDAAKLLDAPPNASLKSRLIDKLWEVVDRHDYLLSATLTGSFVDSPTLRGLSDIDFVVVVDHLNRERYQGLLAEFREALEPVLAAADYDLLINSTLGPLKFNSERLAVLHLMLYSHEAHVEHVINSPFTCLDWQRSAVFRKKSLADVYPVFGLQPRHFCDGRRSIRDYLNDYHARTISYRELECDDAGYREIKRTKPMTDRDLHEFAYHIIRFLMRNLLKLTRRADGPPADDGELADAYLEVFSDSPRSLAEFFRRLSKKKKQLDFAQPLAELECQLTAFVESFEAQFRSHFIERVARHIVFRHAPTEANVGEVRFQGRTDRPPLSDHFEHQPLVDALTRVNPTVCYSSPLQRCRKTLEVVRRSAAVPAERVHDALIEMNYGACEGLSVDEARRRSPELFAGWARGEDPCFPGGENSGQVAARVNRFMSEVWGRSRDNTAVCTHNVVLRTMLGEALGVPPVQRHRLEIPHHEPITLVSTEKFGVFAELTPDLERRIFRQFSQPAK